MRKPRTLGLRHSDLRADVLGKEMAIEKAEGNRTCRTIAICNQKGGVGKTVTTINLAANLAASGLRTLLIDFDPQGHSGLGLGLDIDSLDHSVYDVLLNGTPPVRDAIVSVRPNLEILPSNIDLALAELELAKLEKRERRLREVIDGLRESYDYIVIDCPPSIGILTVNALVASEVVIVPVSPSHLSVRGLSRVLEITEALKQAVSLEVAIHSFVTFFEKRHREARLQRGELERAHGEHLLKTVVRKNTKLKEATRKGISIFEYAPHCIGARDYSDLAKEIMSIEFRKSSEEKNEEESEFSGETVPGDITSHRHMPNPQPNVLGVKPREYS
jgi:chromosome partitioning protein